MHRKGHKASHKRTTRKHKGGYYSMSGAIAPGAANWTRHSEMGDWAVSNRGGNTQYGSGKKRKVRGGMGFCPPNMSKPGSDGKCADGSDPLTYGSKRSMRRKSGKKTMKKSRKQRGNGRFGGVSASYQGSGSRGLADHVGINVRDGSGSAAQGAFNNYGAQPGSGFGSFIKAN